MHALFFQVDQFRRDLQTLLVDMLFQRCEYSLSSFWMLFFCVVVVVAVVVVVGGGGGDGCGVSVCVYVCVFNVHNDCITDPTVHHFTVSSYNDEGLDIYL